MSEISDHINGVEVILRGDIDDIYSLFGNLRGGGVSSLIVGNDVPFVPKDSPDSSAMLDTLSKLVSDSTGGEELDTTDDIVVALRSGLYSTNDVKGVFNFLSQNSALVSKYAQGSFDKSDIATLAMQLLGAQTNPLLTSLVGLVINKIANKKKKKKKKLVGPSANFTIMDEVEDTPIFEEHPLSDVDWPNDDWIKDEGRGKRVHIPTLLKSTTKNNINIRDNQKRKDIRWSTPAGFIKGKQGFFLVGMYNGEIIPEAVHYASHNRSTRMRENADVTEAFAAWVKHENNGGRAVYGYSKIIRVG